MTKNNLIILMLLFTQCISLLADGTKRIHDSNENDTIESKSKRRRIEQTVSSHTGDIPNSLEQAASSHTEDILNSQDMLVIRNILNSFSVGSLCVEDILGDATRPILSKTAGPEIELLKAFSKFTPNKALIEKTEAFFKELLAKRFYKTRPYSFGKDETGEKRYISRPYFFTYIIKFALHMLVDEKICSDSDLYSLSKEEEAFLSGISNLCIRLGHPAHNVFSYFDRLNYIKKFRLYQIWPDETDRYLISANGQELETQECCFVMNFLSIRDHNVDYFYEFLCRDAAKTPLIVSKDWVNEYHSCFIKIGTGSFALDEICEKLKYRLNPEEFTNVIRFTLNMGLYYDVDINDKFFAGSYFDKKGKSELASLCYKLLLWQTRSEDFNLTENEKLYLEIGDFFQKLGDFETAIMIYQFGGFFTTGCIYSEKEAIDFPEIYKKKQIEKLKKWVQKEKFNSSYTEKDFMETTYQTINELRREGSINCRANYISLLKSHPELGQFISMPHDEKNPFVGSEIYLLKETLLKALKRNGYIGPDVDLSTHQACMNVYQNLLEQNPSLADAINNLPRKVLINEDAIADLLKDINRPSDMQEDSDM